MKFAHSPLLSQLVPAWRGRFVLLLLLTGFAGLAARSVFLQAVNHDFLQQKGELRYSRVIDLSATRGRIGKRAFAWFFGPAPVGASLRRPSPATGEAATPEIATAH